MSSDFESLSCASERSHDPWNRNDDEDDHAAAQEGDAGSSDPDMMDDLVAEQDMRLLRQLAIRSSSTLRARQVAQANQNGSAAVSGAAGNAGGGLRYTTGTHTSAAAAFDSDDDNEDGGVDEPEAAAYGYRDFGVTGVPAPPRSSRRPTGLSAASHPSPPRQQQQLQPGLPAERGKEVPSHRLDDTDDDEDDDFRGAGAAAAAALPPRGKVRLFTTGSPSCRSRHAAEGRSAGVREELDLTTLTVPTPGRAVADLVDDAGSPVATHLPPTRTVSGSGSSAAASVSPLRGGAEQRHLVTCPPDSGTITPVASAATLAATNTTRRTNDAFDSEQDEDEGESLGRDGGEDDRAAVDVQRAASSTQSAVLVATARRADPLSVSAAEASATALALHRSRPRPAARDADGFYNIGLLEEDSQDDEEDADDMSDSAALGAAAAGAGRRDVSAGAAASLFHMARGRRAAVAATVGGGGTPQAPLPLRRMQEGAAAAAEESPSRSTPPSSNPVHAGAAAPTVAAAAMSSASACGTAPTPLPLASPTSATSRSAAAAQLRRLAAVLPAMTTVQWLSLLITLLVPVNLICIDVMALSWIRRRVDWGYNARGPSAAAAAMASVREQPCIGTAAASGAGSRGGTSMRCAGVAGNGRSHGDASNTTISPSSTATSTPPGSSRDASAAAVHTVPALCSVFLWLLVPNGLLFRLVQRRLGRRADAAGNTQGKHEGVPAPSRTAAHAFDALREEWAVCREVYARLRRIAPQLEMVELLVRYACLWLVVHAAMPCTSVAEEWTEAWLLKTPVSWHADMNDDGEERGRCSATTAAIAGTQECGSNWRAALDAAASANPRRAADAIVAV